MTPLLPAAEKLTPRHLERRAYVYIRQSTPQQVQQHRASQAAQYALVDRAVTLGWRRERVHVIDADLGQSGQDGQRPGFQELVAAVSLRQVGLILAYEASRLARNNADWYTLLDLAALTGALIADAEGVYDPGTYNDRLLLGLRGMLSEAELHLLRLRLDAGRLRHVEAGTYRQHLPTGLVRLEDRRVVKDPDLQIQRTLELVFARFAALGSAQKVMRSLRDDGILLPRRQRGGPYHGQVLWRKPSAAALSEILRNPAYAGAFTYGRKGPHPDRRPGQARATARPLEEWTTIQQGVYPAYISWEQYMANRARLADNASTFARRARAAPRDGVALLAGLVVCGRCGYQMHVVYKPRQRYACVALAAAYGAATCLHIDGSRLDAAVVEAFFAALAPAELDLLEEVLAAQRADQARLAQHYTDQVSRAEYEARLAERQYRAVDPENRLVAAELERRWEAALSALKQAEGVYAAQQRPRTPAVPLPPEVRARLEQVGEHLPALWTQGVIGPAHQKALLRTLIDQVVLQRLARDRVQSRIVWRGGETTTLEVPVHVGAWTDLAGAETAERIIVEESARGVPDEEIARRLTEQGFRSPQSHEMLPNTVRIGRLRHRIFLQRHQSHPRRVPGYLTVPQITQALGLPPHWIYDRIYNGTVEVTKDPRRKTFLFPDTLATLEQFRRLKEGSLTKLAF